MNFTVEPETRMETMIHFKSRKVIRMKHLCECHHLDIGSIGYMQKSVYWQASLSLERFVSCPVFYPESLGSTIQTYLYVYTKYHESWRLILVKFNSLGTPPILEVIHGYLHAEPSTLTEFETRMHVDDKIKITVMARNQFGNLWTGEQTAISSLPESKLQTRLWMLP